MVDVVHVLQNQLFQKQTSQLGLILIHTKYSLSDYAEYSMKDGQTLNVSARISAPL